MTALVKAAEELIGGSGEVLGARRHDMADPTWHLDPVSGLRFGGERTAWRVDYRSPGRNVKQVWELSRLQHLTVLACAWQCTKDDRYAAMVDRHLRSWWAANPVAFGVNWTSGIEVGIRLMSFVWIRRLLDGWEGAAALFEEDETFAGQLYWHQRYLAAFQSRGSSANNHAVAEAAGLLTASCAFPWFRESRGWQVQSLSRLGRELERNTFGDGLDREQAFDYHGLVCELGLVSLAEADAAGLRVPDHLWALLCRMLDVVAAVLDRNGEGPRTGDGDDGRGLVVADPDANRWLSLLAVGEALFGRLAWWPAARRDAQRALLGALVGRVIPVEGRSAERPSTFPDAGLTILRSEPGAAEELWCCCDGGPQGFGSLAAHGHADALSIELRHDGVQLLCDPGTYAYHDDPAWRAYFRSTLAHNTIELDGEDQAVAGGPFLWTSKANAVTCAVGHAPTGAQSWSGEHRGYARLERPVTHRRMVTLDPGRGVLAVSDELCGEGPHTVRLAFHLGPAVDASLVGNRATLRWTSPGGRSRRADLVLPDALGWEMWRGSVDPRRGWYSPRFGVKVATTTLLGTGATPASPLRTELRTELVVDPLR